MIEHSLIWPGAPVTESAPSSAHGFAQGHEEGRDVVGRVAVDVALPVGAGVHEDHVGQLVVVVVVGQVGAAVLLGPGVRRADDVVDQVLQQLQRPAGVGAGAVVGQVREAVAVLVALGEHAPFDGEAAAGLDAVVLAEPGQVRLEVRLVVGRAVEDRVGVGRQHEVAVRRDARQLAAAVGVEADADQQHPQRRGRAVLRRRGRARARTSRDVAPLEQAVDRVEALLEDLEAPLRRRARRLAARPGEQPLRRDLHDRHLDGRARVARRGGGRHEPQAQGHDQPPARVAEGSLSARCAVGPHACPSPHRFAPSPVQKS
ncbi:MAG: hypothetical protein IPM94_02575 [bacterium]|nr:hypothetical protein [bacterium]